MKGLASTGESGVTVEQAYARCALLARTHYENFTVAARFLSKEVLPHLSAIYAYCRGVDDLGDEAEGDRLALLDAWHIQEKSARQLCLGIGRRPGALRGLSQTLRLASMFAATTGAARPTAEHIRDAWHDLGGEA